jgi:hyperosmotically inducible periplasmic protein
MRHPLEKVARIVLAGALLAGGAGFSAAQEAGVKADNTKVNKQDGDKSAVTADQQKENKSDREIARQIRKALVADKSLSTYAHNVKVIAQHGTVTLKGPVRSEEEKKTVEQKAAEVAGESNVKNEITVVSADTGKRSSKAN